MNTVPRHKQTLDATACPNTAGPGVGETDLMRLAGWRLRSMVGRYGASAANERTREAHKRRNPGDRI